MNQADGLQSTHSQVRDASEDENDTFIASAGRFRDAEDVVAVADVDTSAFAPVPLVSDMILGHGYLEDMPMALHSTTVATHLCSVFARDKGIAEI